MARLQIQSPLLAMLLALPLLATPIEDQLVIRTYKLDLIKINALRETDLFDAPPPTNFPPSEILRALFLKEGVSFPVNFLAANPGSNRLDKAFYLNERTGELHLRATRRETPKLEKHLMQLSHPPESPPDPFELQTRFEIQTIVVEIPQSAAPPTTSRLLTLQPGLIFTNLASLKDFTNVFVLTEKARAEALKTLQNTEGATIIEKPTAKTFHGRMIHLIGPELIQSRPPVISPPSSFGNALIIRSQSDVQ